jgi:large subunit ribosomal protein L22
MAYSSKIAGAKAYGRRIDMSPKHAMEICNHIKGMNAVKADELLTRIYKKQQYLPIKRYLKKIGHKPGMMAGQYPVKAARIIQKILRNAMSNAEQKGMDKEKLVIVHANAHRGPTYARRKPKGRWTYHQIDTTHVEIIVNA